MWEHFTLRARNNNRDGVYRFCVFIHRLKVGGAVHVAMLSDSSQGML